MNYSQWMILNELSYAAYRRSDGMTDIVSAPRLVVMLALCLTVCDADWRSILTVCEINLTVNQPAKIKRVWFSSNRRWAEQNVWRTNCQISICLCAVCHELEYFRYCSRSRLRLQLQMQQTAAAQSFWKDAWYKKITWTVMDGKSTREKSAGGKQCRSIWWIREARLAVRLRHIYLPPLCSIHQLIWQGACGLMSNPEQSRNVLLYRQSLKFTYRHFPVINLVITHWSHIFLNILV